MMACHILGISCALLGATLEFDRSCFADRDGHFPINGVLFLLHFLVSHVRFPQLHGKNPLESDG